MVAFIKEHAKVPLGEFTEQFRDTAMTPKGVPEWVFQEKDMTRLIDKPFINNIQILVAGGTGEKSMILPCRAAGSPATSEIRLPANWAELIDTK